MSFINKFFHSREMINDVYADDLASELTDEQLELVQRNLLEMLLDILNVCKKHDIPIFLGGGTALGAVRHGGFIPWDDDMDINMPHEYFEKFIRVFEEELEDRYILCAPNYKEGSLSRFPKIYKKDSYYELIGGHSDKRICKLFIDIFLMEYVPENKWRATIKGLHVNALEFIAGLVLIHEFNDERVKQLFMRGGKADYYFRRFLGMIFSFKTTASWNNSIDKAVQYKKRTTKVNFPTGRKHYFGEILEYDKLFPLTEIDFCGYSVPIFKGYDYYLSNLYGDYMVLPPVEKRERHFVVKMEL